MRVLFYINTLGVGGAERIVSEEAKYLKNSGHEVAIMVLYKLGSIVEEDLSVNGIPILSIDKGNTLIGKMGKIKRVIFRHFIKNRINQIISEFSPDLIHINTNAKYLNLFSFPADRMVFTFHSQVERFLHIGGLRNKLNLREYASKGMWFTALSNNMLNEIEVLYSTKRIQLIPNFIDVKELRKNTYSKQFVSSEFGIPEDAYIVGHVGRFHPVKNHDKLLLVFREIIKTNPSAYLLLIGSGSPKEIESLKDNINKLGLSERVVLCGERMDATSIIASFDVLIMPSISESFSLVTLEAQANNVKCVISDCIPQDIICNTNCISLDLDLDDVIWAKNALKPLPCKQIKNIVLFDHSNVLKHLLEYYTTIIGA